MNTDLLESMTSQLTPQMLQKISSFLGETPGQTQTAVDRAIPILLAGLMHFSSFPNGPTQLLNLLNQANYGSLLNNLSGLLDGGNTTQNVMTAGQEILRVVFADKLSAVSELIAAASGVTNASASSLLSLTAPVVVGVLARARSAQGLNAARLTTLLMGQKEAVAKLAPAELAGVFGLSNLTNLGPKLTDTRTSQTPTPVRHMAASPMRDKSMLKKWRWPMLGAIAVVLIYFLVGRDSGITRSLMINWMPASTPTVATVTLPDGTVLSLKEGSFNYNVAKFLGDAAIVTVPKAFVFDRLHFDSDTAQLTTESVQTVDELSAILKAYPSADVRLDGHTDSIGNAAGNKKLSLDRAVAVQEALIKDGISATRVTTAGYGQEYPLASNKTTEEQAKNQRLELVVVKK
jgi:hypothetical protein